MPYIQTVLGRTDPENVSFCHSHEHILLSKGVSFERNPALLLDDYEKSLAEVNEYRKAGGNTIVEAQPVGANRVADGLVRIAKESGVNILASTGFHKMMFYPEKHWIFTFSEEELTGIFVHELTCGMYTECDNSKPEKFIDAKAGLIKCALDSCGLDGQYKKLFMAAGKACRKTGAPMMVHIEKGSDPEELLAFLDENNIRPEKLVFCHMDRACADLGIHKRVAKAGAFLEYDTIGRFKYHSDEREAEIIKELISSGYEDSLLASLDTTRERLKAYNPQGIGLTYIIKTFIPLLKRAGVSEKQIEKMMCENARKAYSFTQAL